MEALKQAGKARSIGVSNYGPAPMKATLAAARVPPAINQIEFHPYLQQREWVECDRAHGVATSAYGALTAVTKARPGPADAVYARLAQKYGVADGVIALRWCLDQDIVAVTTSGKEARLREYLGVLNFALEQDEVRELADAGQAKHFRGFWTRKLES
jgi:diketogulonate reductase-like aldo/keto reductase